MALRLGRYEKSDLERLSLIEQGYSFCMEKMVKAVMAETATPAEIDLDIFAYM